MKAHPRSDFSQYRMYTMEDGNAPRFLLRSTDTRTVSSSILFLTLINILTNQPSLRNLSDPVPQQIHPISFGDLDGRLQHFA